LLEKAVEERGMDESAEMRSKISSLEVQDNICGTRAEREALRETIRLYVAQEKLAAPLALDDLFVHADRILDRTGLGSRYRDFASVLLHNEVWRPRLAAVPYDRRLLLLPKCLRDPDRCEGAMDEFGLVCARCGSCVLDEIHGEAGELGYVVMVAEGSPLVMALIESGQVEAVVGVSCLSVLEKVFPYMESAAVPGMAIPILREGCERTTVDLEWVWDGIYLNNTDPALRLNLDALRREVRACFTSDALQKILGPERSQTEGIARAWLAKSGKRWRPFLTGCVVQTVQHRVGKALPTELHKLLAAVESFHKASLIHDDIEDGDLERYGEKTLHAEYGVPVALNAGDFLVGEGYRLIGELEVPPELKVRMLQVAAAGHRTLCTGQGEELCWLLHRKPLTSKAVLSIFRQKTAPAFEVALHLGALFAGADGELVEMLHCYSEALGVAYQIRDDLADSGLEDNALEDNALEDCALEDSSPEDRAGPKDPVSLSPSLLLSLAWERARGEDRRVIETYWRERPSGRSELKILTSIMRRMDVVKTARTLLAHYRKEAVKAVASVENLNLKIALHRLVGKIFSDHTVMGCCNDHQAKHAAHSGAGKKATE